MNPQKLYDLWTETVGGGKQGHPHFDNMDEKDRFQFGRLHKKLKDEYAAMDEPAPPPPDEPGGNGP